MAFSQTQPHVIGTTAANASVSERLRFLRKVYSLLFSAIIVFFASAALPVWGMLKGIEPLNSIGMIFVQMNPLITFGLIIGASFVAHLVMMKPGLNLIALYGFAMLFGLVSVGLVGYSFQVGGFTILLQALGLTTLVFGGLSSYVFITRKDFSFMGGFLFVGLCILIGAVLISILANMVFGVNVTALNLGLTIASTLLFSLYVLYDTSRILHHFTPDMAVAGALSLLIDFIILFRNILTMLALSRD